MMSKLPYTVENRTACTMRLWAFRIALLSFCLFFFLSGDGGSGSTIDRISASVCLEPRIGHSIG